ncbi:MAG: tetratricopeptide repeat protein [Candidatus Omnitrophota bacterium]
MIRSAMVRTGMVCVILAATFIGMSAARVFADYDAGLEAYKRGDYAAALAKWLPLAEEGDAKAQNAVGLLYAAGLGLPQDYAEAITWYRKAAEGGYPSAMHNLGVMYANGQGLTPDFSEAAKWYHAAAERGHVGAQHKLIELYAEGKGVPRDNVQAYTWLLIAGCEHDEHKERAKAIAGQLTPEQIAEAEKNASERKVKRWQGVDSAK